MPDVMSEAAALTPLHGQPLLVMEHHALNGVRLGRCPSKSVLEDISWSSMWYLDSWDAVMAFFGACRVVILGRSSCTFCRAGLHPHVEAFTGGRL